MSIDKNELRDFVSKIFSYAKAHDLCDPQLREDCIDDSGIIIHHDVDRHYDGIHQYETAWVSFQELEAFDEDAYKLVVEQREYARKQAQERELRIREEMTKANELAQLRILQKKYPNGV